MDWYVDIDCSSVDVYLRNGIGLVNEIDQICFVNCRGSGSCCCLFGRIFWIGLVILRGFDCILRYIDMSYHVDRGDKYLDCLDDYYVRYRIYGHPWGAL